MSFMDLTDWSELERDPDGRCFEEICGLVELLEDALKNEPLVLLL
jgi:hypothetical protein